MEHVTMNRCCAIAIVAATVILVKLLPFAISGSDLQLGPLSLSSKSPSPTSHNSHIHPTTAFPHQPPQAPTNNNAKTSGQPPKSTGDPTGSTIDLESTTEAVHVENGSMWHLLYGRDSRNDRQIETCNGEHRYFGRSRLALISLSHRTDGKSGPREHMEVVSKYMKMYALRVGADFHVLETLCAEDVAPTLSAQALNLSLAKAQDLYVQVSSPALARMQKLLVGTFLQLYDRVLLLDDTVMIHPRTPDLFKIVPLGWLGAVYERPKLRIYFPRWLRMRTRAFCAHYLQAKCPGAEFMFNSGVILFDKSMQHTLFDAKYFHKYKYVMYFYDQAYFNAMVAGHNIKVFDLGVSFNRVGSTITARPKRQVWLTGIRNKQACMPHMTRAVHNRVRTAKKFDKVYKAALQNSTMSCKYECGDFGCWVPGGPLPKPTKPKPVKLYRLSAKNSKLQPDWPTVAEEADSNSIGAEDPDSDSPPVDPDGDVPTVEADNQDEVPSGVETTTHDAALWHVLHGPTSGQDRSITTCDGEEVYHGRSKLAVLTISHRLDSAGGPREHVAITAKYMKLYAAKVGADFHVIDTLCVESAAPMMSAKALNISFSKATKLYNRVSGAALARMQKLLVGMFLNLYERILLLDDTVMIHPSAPDLFKTVPKGMLGAVFERPKVRQYFPNWLRMRTRAFCAYYLHSRCPGADFMFNSGVLLFDKSLKNSLFDAKYFHKYKYVMYFYDQAYFNAMVAGHNIPVFDLGVSFNRVGSTITAKPKRQVWLTGIRNKDACMPHMTRAVRNRVRTAKKFDKIYQRAMHNSSMACIYECGQHGCWVPGGPLPKPDKVMNISLIPLS